MQGKIMGNIVGESAIRDFAGGKVAGGNCGNHCRSKWQVKALQGLMARGKLWKTSLGKMMT